MLLWTILPLYGGLGAVYRVEFFTLKTTVAMQFCSISKLRNMLIQSIRGNPYAKLKDNESTSVVLNHFYMQAKSSNQKWATGQIGKHCQIPTFTVSYLRKPGQGFGQSRIQQQGKRGNRMVVAFTL